MGMVQTDLVGYLQKIRVMLRMKLLLLMVERLEQIWMENLMLLWLLLLLLHLFWHRFLRASEVFLEDVGVQIILAVEEHAALDTLGSRSRLVNYGQVSVEVSLCSCAELTTIDVAYELKMLFFA